MSPHIFFIGALEAERLVADAVWGSGPGPVVPDAESNSRARELAGRLRSLFGTGLIRAGETILGPGCPNPLTEGAAGRS
jgi:hypothetical protein